MSDVCPSRAVFRMIATPAGFSDVSHIRCKQGTMKNNCTLPLRLARICSTTSRLFMPHSIRATATSTGALPSPATQWMATHTGSFSFPPLPSLSFSFSLSLPEGEEEPAMKRLKWCGGEVVTSLSLNRKVGCSRPTMIRAFCLRLR